MKQSKWFLHPALIFVFSIVALGLSLFLYIYWYVAVSSRLQTVIRRFALDPGQFFELKTWVVIVILSILVGLILAGLFIIFIYNVKIQQLYHLQQNFINSFTHELKTPVTSIKLFLETLRKHELPRDRQLKYIDYMLTDAARLTADINRILNLARLESGTYAGEFVELDLVRVVREFIDKNAHLFDNCGIELRNPGNAPLIHPVDLALFEMLLMNLLTNALKYNDAEQAKIAISFERLENKVRIAFSDNGRGLARKECRKIFKKFYQIKNTDQASSGSGLGLYLVDKIAKIHQGKIKVKSPGIGQGATFTLTLPSAGRDRMPTWS